MGTGGEIPPNPIMEQNDDDNMLDMENREIPSLLQRRKKAHSETVKPGIDIPMLDFKGRRRSRKCVSFLDQAGGVQPAPLVLPENKAKSEDTGELDESDEESEITNIKAFLGSHNIQISLKNPGK